MNIEVILASFSILIGALSIIVTLLIGWNIWATINIDRKIKASQKGAIDVFSKITDAHHLLSLAYSVGLSSCSYNGSEVNKIKQLDVFNYALNAIELYSNYIDKVEQYMLKCIHLLRSAFVYCSEGMSVYDMERSQDKLKSVDGRIGNTNMIHGDLIDLIEDIDTEIQKRKKQKI